ncbi:hypothetical protein CYLTODRAFT_364485 [Cylindrobasidium torrendii FP15055 ss-10]|uniref:BRCT domain-containing protein n=1 Tax=Cylindrobasidium torrendii FP15055 ss-10 TaxID=1314674 RepID=A0A0D7BWU4_9AGAR|nr:hypothetical protein CYLTODRAFT_364485 [Cylindrobasidium torrendii FP15055 ss-10]
MERYFAVAKSNKNVSQSKGKTRYQPYPSTDPGASAKPQRAKPTNSLLKKLDVSDLNSRSSSRLTGLLLHNLSNEANPLTHSDLYERSDHAISTSTGHQVADGAGGSAPGYWEQRTRKLAVQREDAATDTHTHEVVPQVLRHTRIYINGYLDGTTDIEMKRIVTEAGGQILMTKSTATHILTSMPLNASKMQQSLSAKKPAYVVTPEWVFDSIKAGKRKPERVYSIMKSKTSGTLDIWTAKT